MNRSMMMAVAGAMMAKAGEHKGGGGGTAPFPSEPVKTPAELAAEAGGVKPGNELGAAASTAVGAVLDFEGDAGAGMEGADKDSFAIPFILVLQPLSPVVVEKTVPGAEAGMFMNSVTNELVRELYLIPCAFQRRWIRWGAREAGGGFKGEFTTAQATQIQASGEVKNLEGRLYYPAADGSINPKRDDRLVDTRTHFLLAIGSVGGDLAFPAAFPLSSSGVKVSKNWMSRIDGIKLRKGNVPTGELYTPPSFSHIYKATTHLEKNEKGSWYLPDIVNVLGADGKAQSVTNVRIYAQAKAFSKSVLDGATQVAYETMNKAGGEGGSDGPRAEGSDGRGF